MLYSIFCIKRMASSNSYPSKEEHLKLAGVVKGVHAKLRKNYKDEPSDIELIWSSHLEDKQTLSDYADAMHHLAKDVWTKNPETRIDWCINTCKNYLFCGTGLKKQLEKDEKRNYFAELNATDISDEEEANESDVKVVHDVKHMSENTDVGIPNVKRQVDDKVNDLSDFDSYALDDKEYNEESSDEVDNWTADMSDRQLEEERKAVYSKYKPRQYSTITIPFEGKIRLLDVGSCYNPFVSYDEFLAVGIDISPAVDSVFYCDFLHVEVTEPLEMAGDAIESYIRNGIRAPVSHLPGNLFHVVVFSLLLEYFPCPYQRWICCEKANKLLMVNGLLIIITPDSHHQNKNAQMMKSWKTAIESMGFKRWKYEKLTHLHCMAFRKLAPSQQNETIISPEMANANMLYIPQDYNNSDTMQSFYNTNFSHLYEESSLKETFDELPNCVDF